MGKIIKELSDLFVLSCFAGSLYFIDNTLRSNKYGFRPEHFNDKDFLTQQGSDYISKIGNSLLENGEICQLFYSCVEELNKTIGK